MIFGCCQLFVVGSASWCFHQTHWLLGSVQIFGSKCPLRVHRLWGVPLQCWVFWDETCQMVSLQWLEPSEFCFWRGSMVGGADVCFWITAVGTDITACLSQLFGSWVHWWRRVLCCDDVVKTENLDWIFLLDVSLPWGWPVDASVLLSTSGNVDFCQTY